jgi:hypothetical protein
VVCNICCFAWLCSRKWRKAFRGMSVVAWLEAQSLWAVQCQELATGLVHFEVVAESQKVSHSAGMMTKCLGSVNRMPSESLSVTTFEVVRLCCTPRVQGTLTPGPGCVICSAAGAAKIWNSEFLPFCQFSIKAHTRWTNQPQHSRRMQHTQRLLVLQAHG